MLTPMNLKVGSEGLHEENKSKYLMTIKLRKGIKISTYLGNKIVSLHDLVQNFVTFDGWLQIAHENLQSGPKSTEGIDKVFRGGVRSMHVNILHYRSL